MAGDELRLLSLIGGQVYRLSDPTIQTPGHAFACSDYRETNGVSRGQDSAIERASHAVQIQKSNASQRSEQNARWMPMNAHPRYDPSALRYALLLP